ncbi:MAG: hypothetical protein IMY80_08245 [Chloroflexi bacterium]|nr:hypothetical protein [Chloroflexota bacterium]
MSISSFLVTDHFGSGAPHLAWLESASGLERRGWHRGGQRGQLSEGFQRTIARQVEAEREKRAKTIHPGGQREAPVTLAEAAQKPSVVSANLQLRYQQALVKMSSEQSTTILPIPIDIMCISLLVELPKAGTHNPKVSGNSAVRKSVLMIEEACLLDCGSSEDK